MLVAIELAVRSFPRYHKYALGGELRQTAMRLCKAIHRAVTRKRSRLKLIQQVAELTDDIKLQIQLAKEVQAFASFAQFQSVAELAVGLGKQAGGWEIPKPPQNVGFSENLLACRQGAGLKA